jgi:putative chitinase
VTIALTREAWKRFAPRCPAAWTDVLFSNLSLLGEAGLLGSELRWCHFAATVYEETGGFTELRESLKYTHAATLRKTWPSRFGHRSDAELAGLLRNERALAEAVYGGRMGNRPGTSDAFDFRGGGWIQTTGRAAVEGYATKLGIVPSPATLDDPATTLRFAVLEWTEGRCNTFCDANDIVKVAKVINTGSASSNVVPIGMNDRRKAFARAWAIWGDTGAADAPADAEDIPGHGKAGAVGGTVGTLGAVAVYEANGLIGGTRVSFGERLDQARQAAQVAQELRAASPAWPAWTGQLVLPSLILGVGLVAALILHRRG